MSWLLYVHFFLYDSIYWTRERALGPDEGSDHCVNTHKTYSSLNRVNKHAFHLGSSLVILNDTSCTHSSFVYNIAFFRRCFFLILCTIYTYWYSYYLFFVLFQALESKSSDASANKCFNWWKLCNGGKSMLLWSNVLKSYIMYILNYLNTTVSYKLWIFKTTYYFMFFVLTCRDFFLNINNLFLFT